MTLTTDQVINLSKALGFVLMYADGLDAHEHRATHIESMEQLLKAAEKACPKSDNRADSLFNATGFPERDPEALRES